MNDIIICKLIESQMQSPIMLLIVDVAMQILLQYLIDTFNLIMSLIAKSKQEFNFHLQDFKEGSPKFKDKL